MIPIEEPRRPPRVLTGHWCPKCGDFRPPFSGLVPKVRHWFRGEKCNGVFTDVRYTIEETA